MKASDIDLASIQDAVDANADSYAVIIEDTELRKQQLKKLRYPRVLGQGGVPIYVLPTGSIAANGAITLGTALSVIESGGMWGYLPAGAAFASSAAGFYWIVMSSSTLGTVYQETYTPGISSPNIPATNTAIVDAGPGAYTGVTTEITAVSIPMAGGLMGANGSVKHRVLTEFFSSATNKGYHLKWNTADISAVATITTNVGRSQIITTTNRGRVDRQISPGGTTSSDSLTGTVAGKRTTIDTSATVTITVTLQNIDAATDWSALTAWELEVRYQA